MKRKPRVNARRVLTLIALLLSLGAFLSEGASSPGYAWTGDSAEWTFMVYMDADNNLEEAGIADFLELSSVGSTSDVNIVVQFDRWRGDGDYGDWTDTRRFHVTQGLEPTGGVSIGEANMGDPQTLIDFVEWGMSSYPADRYAVILWNHGDGWYLTLDQAPAIESIAIDDTDGDALNMPELRSAVATLSDNGADPIDLVGFDACLMAMAEVDNELIPYANVRVGSEENEPWDGWPYTPILTALTGDPTMSAAQLGTEIVDAYYASYEDGWTQSATDLDSAYATLNSAIDEFARALIGGMATHSGDIVDARTYTERFYYHYVDLYDFADQINRRVNDTAINSAATSVMNAVDGAVIHEQHGADWAGAHGISIYFPASESSYRSTYDGSQGFLQLTANTFWDEWLQTYYAGEGVVGPLTVDRYTIDDDDIGGSSGNNDGIVNPGETIELYVTLRNQGIGTATGVTATLSTGDAYISGFVSTGSSYPDILGMETATSSDAWRFTTNPSTPDGHQVTFCLDPILDAEGGEWTDCFDLNVGNTRYVYFPLISKEEP